MVKPPALKTVDAVFFSQNVKDTLKSYSLSSSYNWLRDESCFVDLPSQSLNKRLVNNNDKKKKNHILFWIPPTQTLLISLWKWSLWIINVWENKCLFCWTIKSKGKKQISMIPLAPQNWGPPWCSWDRKGSGKERREEKTHAWNFQARGTVFFFFFL